ncbi:hypothetical protein PEBR_07794 [Penicillium brasilianum]|uniref:Uncharacterized protein n=1 Tax=Penicillium brasilianum TaxID=104259 RepID=A0A1S9RW63_PENBI|nr:hypothetical protein PEBR_07794 [Penicillium brasilianum]
MALRDTRDDRSSKSDSIQALDSSWARIFIHGVQGHPASKQRLLDSYKHLTKTFLENLCARSLPALLGIAVAVIDLYTSTCLDSAVEESAALELELLNRLSLSLLLPEPIPRNRLTVLHARYNFKMTEMLYRAASGLDIEIYVLAEPGGLEEQY